MKHQDSIHTPAPETQGFAFAHTMLRVKDLDKSLEFYTGALGMSVVRLNDYDNGEFSLCFLTYLAPNEMVPKDEAEKRHWLATRQGVLELTHNWGTEKQSDFSYHTGNGETGGYGHIAISVPDFDAAIAWLDKNNIPFKKRPEDGRMRDIAFVYDPDGYWVEIIKQRND